MKRYAIVRGYMITRTKVAMYLPSNYEVVWEGMHDYHKSGVSKTWLRFPTLNDYTILIEGTDDHGWTLDKYVIPRLESGGMRCDEVDLSHLVMKGVSA